MKLFQSSSVYVGALCVIALVLLVSCQYLNSESFHLL
jgi:hypothetical protein